jgi:hypothetical protein
MLFPLVDVQYLQLYTLQCDMQELDNIYCQPYSYAMTPFQKMLNAAKKQRPALLEDLRSDMPIELIAKKYKITRQRLYQIEAAEGIKVDRKRRKRTAKP